MIQIDIQLVFIRDYVTIVVGHEILLRIHYIYELMPN